MQYGHDLKVPLALGDLVAEIFGKARREYGGTAWSSQVVKLLEDEVGQNLRAAGFPEAL